MPKALKSILHPTGYTPKAEGEKAFVRLHTVKKHEYRAEIKGKRVGSGDEVFNASKIKHADHPGHPEKVVEAYRGPHGLKVRRGLSHSLTPDNRSIHQTAKHSKTEKGLVKTPRRVPKMPLYKIPQQPRWKPPEGSHPQQESVIHEISDKTKASYGAKSYGDWEHAVAQKDKHRAKRRQKGLDRMMKDSGGVKGHRGGPDRGLAREETMTPALMEISSKVLRSYIKKASGVMGQKASKGPGPKKIMNRLQGITKAYKMSKEETALDELSTKTLTSYLRKRDKDKTDHHKIATTTKDPSAFKKSMKKLGGYDRAYKKIRKAGAEYH